MPTASADRTKPYTFETMSPSGGTAGSVTVMALDRDQATDIAVAKVEEWGETVLDVQDHIIVIPDE